MAFNKRFIYTKYVINPVGCCKQMSNDMVYNTDLWVPCQYRSVAQYIISFEGFVEDLNYNYKSRYILDERGTIHKRRTHARGHGGRGRGLPKV